MEGLILSTSNHSITPKLNCYGNKLKVKFSKVV